MTATNRQLSGSLSKEAPNKILQIVNDLGLRGTQRAAIAFTKELARRNWEVTVLVKETGGQRERELKKLGVRVIAQSDPGFEKEIYWINPDILHVHRPVRSHHSDDLLARLGAREKLVLETNVFGRVDYKNKPGIVDVRLHVSAHSFSRWTHWLGPIDQIGALVPNPLEVKNFFPSKKEKIRATREKLGIDEDAYIIGQVGYKFSTAIKSACEAVAHHRKDVVLLRVPGQESEWSGYLESSNYRTVCTGEISSDEELREIYSVMDCLLHAPVNGETFGYVIAEALLCCVPVVTIATPHKDNAQTEVCVHQVTGLVATSVSSFKRAAIDLMHDQSAREVYGKTGRLRVLESYSSETVCDALERLIRLAYGQESATMKCLIHTDARVVSSVPDYIHRRYSVTGSVGRKSMTKIILQRLIQSYWIQRFYRALFVRKI